MLGFCVECRDNVEYFIKEEIMTQNIKGTDYKYVGKIAFCSECENEMFVAEIRDYNLMKLDEAFRKEEDLITVPEMEYILEKYNIGKRPLSLLLGWGELTLTRYLDGDIPTKQYSETLRKILSEPDYMKELLEKNKDALTDIAYKRCSEALLNVEDNKQLDFSSPNKIDHVVKYLLVNLADITPLALQKLLYYSQGFFKIFTGEYLFNNDCEAWVHGPVYKNVYQQYKNYGYNPILSSSNEWTDIELTRLEKEVVDSVIRNFGCYSGKVLEGMTHVEAPWSETRIGLSDDEKSNRIIEKELIKRYFTNIKLKHNMLNISDIKDYSTDLFDKLYG